MGFDLCVVLLYFLYSVLVINLYTYLHRELSTLSYGRKRHRMPCFAPHWRWFFYYYISWCPFYTRPTVECPLTKCYSSSCSSIVIYLSNKSISYICIKYNIYYNKLHKFIFRALKEVNLI